MCVPTTLSNGSVVHFESFFPLPPRALVVHRFLVALELFSSFSGHSPCGPPVFTVPRFCPCSSRATPIPHFDPPADRQLVIDTVTSSDDLRREQAAFNASLGWGWSFLSSPAPPNFPSLFPALP